MTTKFVFSFFVIFSAFTTKRKRFKDSRELETKKERDEKMLKMPRKLLGLLVLHLVKSYSEPPNSMKITLSDKQFSKGKITGKLRIYPNESDVGVFRDLETNEISWEDPHNLVANEKKNEIEFCLQRKEEERSDCLFDRMSFGALWNHPVEPVVFLREILFAMAENVDIQRGEEFYTTPLMFAVQLDAEKAVAKLIERGAELETADEYGWNALHLGSYTGNNLSCKVLLQKGANVDAEDDKGFTALMLAAENGHTEVVKTLLQLNANAKITNKHGKTASQRAREYHHHRTADVIEAKLTEIEKF